MTKEEMVQFALKSDDTVENTMWNIYQQGRAEAIDKIYSYVKRECNPYGKPTIDFESGMKILNYLNKLKEIEE